MRVEREGIAEQGDTLGEVTRFMDKHLLRWLPLFPWRMAERRRSWFCAALALLTEACCEDWRSCWR